MNQAKKIDAPSIPMNNIHAFVDELFRNDFHVKRIKSLANATMGVINSGSLCVHAMGRGLAAANGLKDKHAVKQVDRLIGNEAIDVRKCFTQWVPYVIGNRKEIIIIADWTEFDSDNHSMLVLSIQTNHGRSTPLIWKTFVKSKLKGQRNQCEDELLVLLKEIIPTDVHVTIVADRGFSDQKLFDFLHHRLGFDYIIRTRKSCHIRSNKNEVRTAKNWLTSNGRARILRHAKITQDEYPVATVVCVKDKGMQDAWCIVSSREDLTGTEIKKIYAKRFTCEEMFRDIKDVHFGLGMSWQPIRKPPRRDRLLFVAAIALCLLTLLGSAGERAGLDAILKTNTSKKRTLSLLRQGLRWYDLVPNMPEERLLVLMNAFHGEIRQHAMCRDLLGVI